MTRGPRQCSRKAAQLRRASLLATLVAVGLGACGGAAKHSSTGSSKSTSTSTSTTTAAPAPKPRPALAETLRVGTATTFDTTVKAKAGDALLMRTLLARKAGSPPATIRLKLSAGPAKTLTVTATSGRHTAVAKIVSADGKPLTLVRLHYSCQLPPVATFCPPQKASGGRHGFELRFAAAHPAVVQVQATVGPVSIPTPRVRIAGSSVVPAYKPTELVEAVSPPPPGAPPGTRATAAARGATATVKPGNVVVMATRLSGAPVGATQATTITIEQGPASSIAVSGAVAGGQTSKATVKSADGKPITLVLPRYTCYVAPVPTFCPPKQIQAGSHKYVLKFMASPYTPPLAVIATVEAG